MLTIRLRRIGGTNAPAYRVVVSDSRSTPTTQVIDELGYYDPTKNPPLLKLDADKAQKWIKKGAVPSTTVKRLIPRASGAAAPAAA